MAARIEAKKDLTPLLVYMIRMPVSAKLQVAADPEGPEPITKKSTISSIMMIPGLLFAAYCKLA